MTYGAYIKWGPYCWDHSNYTTGESREISGLHVKFFESPKEDLRLVAGASSRCGASGTQPAATIATANKNKRA
ncbi:MAG: hypothetical protein EOO38_23230 [Cytophagaceae bacterium]|nr:MAG: hypothetical protein EOO38_23230 [Cytophagaceae bacterium]